MSDAVRRRGALLLRVVVSALLLGALLVYVDAGEMVQAVRDADWRWFLAGLGLMGVAVVVGAARWRLLLEGAQIGVSGLRASKVFAASIVLNLVLPTAVAGDALRAWRVGKTSGQMLRAATATIVDKLVAFGCLVVVAWAAIVIDPNDVPSTVVGVFAWLTGGLVLGFAIAALAVAGVRPIVHRLPDRVLVMLQEVWTMLRAWARSARLLASVASLGLAYQVLVVFGFLLVGKSIGLELPFALVAAALSIVFLASLVPVSIGGLGVREGGLVLLLGQADLGATQATLFSLLNVAMMALASGAVFAVAALLEALRARGGEPSPAPQDAYDTSIGPTSREAN